MILYNNIHLVLTIFERLYSERITMSDLDGSVPRYMLQINDAFHIIRKVNVNAEFI